MKYEYWFDCLKHILPERKLEIRKQFEDIKELYELDEIDMRECGFREEEIRSITEGRRNWELEERYQLMQNKGVHCVPFYHEAYPFRLREIANPPYMLYVKGHLPDERKKIVSMVGARECSAYGTFMAKEFAKALAREGVLLVSGMARGIDSISQRAALEVGGESFAVLGCGVDICYPKEEIDLYEKLPLSGGVISEYPVGMEPLKLNFPARNRIISGLADAVLVIEAKEKSGSLITADMALEQGKDVYALPGNVNSRLSAGCNRLIKQGADILLSPEELLLDLGVWEKKRRRKNCQKKILLEREENLVYSCLDLQPRKLDELIRKTGYSVPVILDILVRLEMMGLVKEYSKNNYVRL